MHVILNVYGVKNFTTKFNVIDGIYNDIIEIENEEDIILTTLPLELINMIRDLLEVKCSELTRDVLLFPRKKNLVFQAITRDGEAIFHSYTPAKEGLFNTVLKNDDVINVLRSNISGYEEEINWLHNAWKNDFSVMYLR